MIDEEGGAADGELPRNEQASRQSPRLVTETVGRRIRVIRTERGLSLRSIAGAAQVSPSLLSGIERGTASPSLVSLVAIAEALGVRPGALLESDGEGVVETSRVIRRDERRVIDDRRCRREYLMHVDDPYLEVAELLLRAGGASRPALARHSGRDYAIVLSGTATVEFGNGSEIISEGDYIAFDSDQPHRVVNNSADEARLIWIVAYGPGVEVRLRESSVGEPSSSPQTSAERRPPRKRR